jgi:hypothetical protein
MAKAGDLAASREIFDRLLGKPKTGAAMDLEDEPEPPQSLEEVVAEIRAVLGEQPIG